MRNRTTGRALALGATVAAFAVAPPTAGATVTDATDGYRLTPAQQRLAGEATASSLTDAAVTVVDDVISQARATDEFQRAERRLRDAGIDTGALRSDVRRQLRDARGVDAVKQSATVRRQLREAGIDPAAVRAAVRDQARALPDAHVDVDQLMSAIRSRLRGANVDVDRLTGEIRSQLRGANVDTNVHQLSDRVRRELRQAGVDSDQLLDALRTRQHDAGRIDADKLHDTIRRQLRDAGVDATAADDAARGAVGAARRAVPNIGELRTGDG